MNNVLRNVIGVLLLVATVLSVILVMMICAITYLPHLIYVSCAGLLHDALNLVTLEEYRAKVRERNK